MKTFKREQKERWSGIELPLFVDSKDTKDLELPRLIINEEGVTGVTFSKHVLNDFYSRNKYLLSPENKDNLKSREYTVFIQLNMYSEITENKSALVDDLSNDLVSFDVFEDVMEKFRSLQTSINIKVRKVLSKLPNEDREKYANLNNALITECASYFHPKIEKLIEKLENEVEDVRKK